MVREGSNMGEISLKEWCARNGVCYEKSRIQLRIGELKVKVLRYTKLRIYVDDGEFTGDYGCMKPVSKYTRVCKTCSKELHYRNLKGYQRAERRQAVCRGCAIKGVEGIDETGNVYGYLTVLGKTTRQTQTRLQRVWECQCKCGNVVIRYGPALRQTRDNGLVSHCGCIRGMNNMLPNNEGQINKYLSSYKVGAVDRNIKFDLSIEEFKDLIFQSCHYCKRAPYRIPSTYVKHNKIPLNGVDRIDNNPEIGYIKSNCVPCCSECNRAKMEMEYDKFINLCHLITQNHLARINTEVEYMI